MSAATQGWFLTLTILVLLSLGMNGYLVYEEIIADDPVVMPTEPVEQTGPTNTELRSGRCEAALEALGEAAAAEPRLALPDFDSILSQKVNQYCK